jgi:2'-5' RNA ligase
LSSTAGGVSAPATRPEPARRLFFALWPHDEERLALALATAKPVRHCGGRPVPVPSLHVTLAFLGSISEARVEELHTIARAVAGEWPAESLPLQLCFDRLAHWAKPQLLCALGSEDSGASGGEARAAADAGRVATLAETLAATLKNKTAAAGFTPDLKPFRAHVTVARKVLHAPAENALPAVAWSFDAFALVESRTQPAGAVYSLVESYVLVKTGKGHG